MGREANYIWISCPAIVRRRWRVFRKRLPQNQHQTNYGDCDTDNAVIRVHKPLSALAFFRTLIHEATHAACPDLSEHAVSRIESAVADVLLPHLEEIVDELTE